MNIGEQSSAVLKPLIVYCLEHDMLDTAEFTAERLLSQENVQVFSVSTSTNETGRSHNNNTYNRNNNSSENINKNKSKSSNFVGMGMDAEAGIGSSETNNNANSLKNLVGTPTPNPSNYDNRTNGKNPDLLNKDIYTEKKDRLATGRIKKLASTSFTNSDLNMSDSKLDAIHLYAYVLFRRGRYKAAYNVTAAYCSMHIGCSYVFAKTCKELQRENEGVRALLQTMNLWESNDAKLSANNRNLLIPDSIACYMLLAKLYTAVSDIPRATMHYSQVLKLNPLIFEAFEELCRLGVRVKVDSIYRNNGQSLNSLFQMDNTGLGFRMNEPILKTEVEQDINLNTGNGASHDDEVVMPEDDIVHPFSYVDTNDNGKERNNNTKNTNMNMNTNVNLNFKTPRTKFKESGIPTSSPDSSFITPISKNYQKSQSSHHRVLPQRSAGNNVIPKKNNSITSRLLHNNNNNNNNNNKSSSNSNNNTNSLNSSFNGSLNREISDESKETTVGSKRDMLSAFGNIPANNVFATMNNNTNNNSSLNNNKALRNKGLNSVFNGIKTSSSLFDIKEHDVIRNLNTEYLLTTYSKLAKAYLALTSYDCFKAIRIFDSLPENERNTPWVISKLGKLHFEIVNYEEAENYFEMLHEMDRTRLNDMEYYSTLLWHLHKEVELSFLAHELFEVEPHSAISWISIGNLFSYRKEPDDAIRCFNKAVECDPKCAYAYTLQGHEYLATDAFENALDSFRHAIVLDKRHYNAFYGIGMVYLKLGDLRKAEFHFRKAVEINPVNVILICCVGMVLEKLGRKEESLKQYEFAAKLQPLSMLALFKKAQILFSMQQYDEALKDFEKLENLAPDEASVHFLLGKLYKHYGRKHDAVKQFTIALNLDPKGSHLIKEAMENLDDGII